MATENLPDYQEKSIAEKWRAAIAHRGFWTLALALAAPASLHCIEIFFLRSPLSASSKPSRFPRNWIYVTWYPRKWIDVTSVYLSLLFSLSYWFCWAENRVIQKPKGVAVVSILYLSLTLAWDQIVFEHGAIECGIAVGLARCLLGQQLINMLRELNETASKYVMLSFFCWTSCAVYYNVLLLIWWRKKMDSGC